MASSSDNSQSAFSASGEEVITRSIDVRVDESVDHLSPEQFSKFYEIERTAHEISERGYNRIALQFPDEWLHISIPIYRLLMSRVREGQELYVLADTSYGSCCVDEVAAKHVDADAIVHYGHACMSKTSRLPVIYVFGKRDIDVKDCVTQLTDLCLSGAFTSLSEPRQGPETVVLKYDVAYTHQTDAIYCGLTDELASHQISVSYEKVPDRTEPLSSNSSHTVDSLSTGKGDAVTSPVVLYIGGESLSLTNLLLTNASSEVYSYNPMTRTIRVESLSTNKLLMKRYAVVQKARDADVVGILVGTLGVASYLPLISHLRNLIKRARKKSYTVSVGKLNPAKLANFAEIECFVLVACPENSLIDAKDFFRPIVTPYELEIAFRVKQSWTGRYVLDFERLLLENAEDSNQIGSQEHEDEDPDQPVFSLVTGKYRHAKRYGDTTNQDSGSTTESAVALRSHDDALAKLPGSAAGQFLQTRTYQGLERRIGEDAPGVLEQGRSGIARGYQTDKEASS